MRYLIFTALLLLPVSGMANKQNKRAVSATQSCRFGTGAGATTVNLSESAGRRTFKWPCVGQGKERSAVGYDSARLTVHFSHTIDGTITFTCTNSNDGGTTQNTPNVCPSGTCADSGVFVTDAALTADKDYEFIMKISGLSQGECVVTHGGSATTDTLKAEWTMFTEGGN